MPPSRTPNFRFSPRSRRAKELGEQLLALTKGYDGLLVPRGMGVGTLAVLGTIARARRLLKQVHVAADSGDAAGAAFPVRALSESVLLLGWASKDEVLAFHVWMLDELRTRIAHHV